MQENVRIVRQLDESKWRRFVDRHPCANIFHAPEMFQVYARTKGYRPLLWAAVDQNDQPLVLFLPVQITLFNGPLRSFSTRSIVFGSVLYQENPLGLEALEVLLKTYARQTKGVLLTELRNMADLTSVQPVLQANGYEYEEQLNYLINLHCTSEEVLQRIGQRTRHRIRKGLRRGEIVIKEINRREDLPLFYNLVSKSYSAARVPLADISLFETAFDILYPLGKVKFLLAWLGDQCIAASAELLHGNMIFGWYSGVDRRFSSYAPNELLMWHVLDLGCKEGYHVYDFGGAGRSYEKYGVRDFKAKFGGDLVEYGRNIIVHNPLHLAISKTGYQLYRMLLGLRTPNRERREPDNLDTEEEN